MDSDVEVIRECDLFVCLELKVDLIYLFDSGAALTRSSSPLKFWSDLINRISFFCRKKRKWARIIFWRYKVQKLMFCL